ncbi:hypothetical protein B0H13DRAFT_1860665 [Mycena leptocephala]|nr:hypothetical protein B0H13DRAFT_1860665 [Mycena leptocephala]
MDEIQAAEIEALLDEMERAHQALLQRTVRRGQVEDRGLAMCMRTQRLIHREHVRYRAERKRAEIEISVYLLEAIHTYTNPAMSDPVHSPLSAEDQRELDLLERELKREVLEVGEVCPLSKAAREWLGRNRSPNLSLMAEAESKWASPDLVTREQITARVAHLVGLRKAALDAVAARKAASKAKRNVERSIILTQLPPPAPVPTNIPSVTSLLTCANWSNAAEHFHGPWFLTHFGMLVRDMDRVLEQVEKRNTFDCLATQAHWKDPSDYPVYIGRDWETILNYLPRLPHLRNKFDRQADANPYRSIHAAASYKEALELIEIWKRGRGDRIGYSEVVPRKACRSGVKSKLVKFRRLAKYMSVASAKFGDDNEELQLSQAG